MITREQLSAAPCDPVKLFEFESDFSDRANGLIDNLLKIGQLKIQEIEFKCTLGGSISGAGGPAAEAQLVKDNCYQILIGRNFSNAINNFSIWSSQRLTNNIFITDDIHELQSYLYEYWMWLTFHHELAHITSGHLDFLLTHGLIRYAEIVGNDETANAFNIAGVATKDVWWAIESEADSLCTAMSLASLPMTRHKNLLSQQTSQQTISMHGLLISLYFFMFEVLTIGADQRHPAPAFRKAICQPSLDKLCKRLHLDSKEATEQMIFADFDVVSSILTKKVDVMPYFEAFNWMLGLDDLLRKMNLKSFRKQ